MGQSTSEIGPRVQAKYTLTSTNPHPAPFHPHRGEVGPSFDRRITPS